MLRAKECEIDVQEASDVAKYLRSLGMSSMDVAEVYNPPRFAAAAPKCGSCDEARRAPSSNPEAPNSRTSDPRTSGLKKGEESTG